MAVEPIGAGEKLTVHAHGKSRDYGWNNSMTGGQAYSKPAVFFRVGGMHAREILRGREERKNTSGNSCQVFVSLPENEVVQSGESSHVIIVYSRDPPPYTKYI